MVLHTISADILLIATTQLAKYPRVLYVKPSNKIYVDYENSLIFPTRLLASRDNFRGTRVFRSLFYFQEKMKEFS